MPGPTYALAGDLHSPADSSVNQSNRPLHGPASSSQATAFSHTAPRVASFSDPGSTTTIAIPGVHGDIQDPNVPSQLESAR